MTTNTCGHPGPHGTIQGRTYCYQCCADLDVIDMTTTGKATLYLVKKRLVIESNNGPAYQDRWFVTNWPDSLSFPVTARRVGKHNIARTRDDVWFVGPDNRPWHGVQYGDFSQICHCKRVH